VGRAEGRGRRAKRGGGQPRASKAEARHGRDGVQVGWVDIRGLFLVSFQKANCRPWGKGRQMSKCE